jgi:hypothetical protein
MLISMPTGNSRIFGAFQNIFLLHVIKSYFVGPTERKPSGPGRPKGLRAEFVHSVERVPTVEVAGNVVGSKVAALIEAIGSVNGPVVEKSRMRVRVAMVSSTLCCQRRSRDQKRHRSCCNQFEIHETFSF